MLSHNDFWHINSTWGESDHNTNRNNTKYGGSFASHKKCQHATDVSLVDIGGSAGDEEILLRHRKDRSA
jgi:hypothetical protein